MVVKTRILPPGANAFTVWPCVFVHPTFADWPSVLLHESIHLEQQRRWAIYGLGVGLLLWFFLYLLVLPFGWNPFRAHWESEAMRAEGKSLEGISVALKKAPYYLWWI